MHNILYLVPFSNLLSNPAGKRIEKNMKSNFMRIPLETEQAHQVFLNLGEVFWVLSSIHYTSELRGQSAIQRQASSTTRRANPCTPSASES